MTLENINQMNRYIVLDTEFDATTKRRRFCDPLDKDHKLIMVQLKPWNGRARYKYNSEGLDRNLRLPLKPFKVLVGHNIKIDLLYLWENETLRERVQNGLIVWDTQVADYLLNGQDPELSYKLKDVSRRYSKDKGEEKLDICQKYFDEGKLFSEIPKDIAIQYAIQDVISTENVYKHQVRMANKRGMLGIILEHMNHLLAVTEIEYNGLYLDKSRLHKQLIQQEKHLNELSNQICEYVYTHTDFPKDKVELNINSGDHLSAILFGGKVKYTGTIPYPSKTGELFYKTGKKAGQPRVKQAVKYVEMKGLKLYQYAIPVKKEGYFQTDKGTLKRIDHPLAKLLVQYGEEHKLFSAYLQSFPELLNPYTGCLHSEFNTTVTKTGRLSSSSPNLQNVSPKIHDCFSSRFEGGKICTIDFSQLEVCIAVYIFNEALLKYEILNGVDIHANNAQLMYQKKDISKKERKTAKGMTFGLLYGAGSKGLSENNGVRESEAQRFIKVFYDKYVGISDGHKRLPDEIKKNGYISTPLGRRYRIHKDPEYNAYPLPKLKNYKMQGTAADIVATSVGRVFRYLQDKRDLVLMVNEIHDELVLDVHPNCPKKILDNVSKIMENTNKYLTKKLKKNIDIILKTDVQLGKTVGECKT